MDELLTNPRHPYTLGLIQAVPRLGSSLEEGTAHQLSEIPGVVPLLDRPIAGCPFAPRCSYAIDRCHDEAPDVRGNRRWTRRHLLSERLGRSGGMNDAIRGPEVLLEAEGLTKHFHRPTGRVRFSAGHRTSRRRRLFPHSSRGSTWVGWRERLRQIDDRETDHMSSPTDGGTNSTWRTDDLRIVRRTCCAPSAAGCRWCFRIPIPRSIRA